MAIIIPELPKIQHHGFFRDGWISMMICGKSGCGKTTLMARLIPMISDKIRIVVIGTVVYRNPFHLAIKDWCAKTGRKCVIADNPDNIRSGITIMHKAGYIVPGKSELLLIFDDFSIHNRSGSQHENLVVEAFTRWRNLGVNICIICQDATMVAPTCRNCTNVRALFSSASKSAIQAFTKDVRDRVPNEMVLQDLIKYISSTPYSYIVVRENPLEVGVGSGGNANHRVTTVMTESDVIVPSYREILSQLKARSMTELEDKAKEMQKEMGNTAAELDEPNDE